MIWKKKMNLGRKFIYQINYNSDVMIYDEGKIHYYLSLDYNGLNQNRSFHYLHFCVKLYMIISIRIKYLTIIVALLS